MRVLGTRHSPRRWIRPAAAEIVDVAETTPGVTQVVNELKPLDQEEPAAGAAKRS